MKKVVATLALFASAMVNAQTVTCSDYIESIDMQNDGSYWIQPVKEETIELKPTHQNFYNYLGLMYNAMQSNKKVVYTSDNGERSTKCHDATRGLFPLYEIVRVVD
ncbi:hypothetical protein NI389_20030 (plasmid) [Pseudoalteromonas xiamenensis]|uniref:hypothetical protein n=1 Tax=Pseudoalteromonas xiamenensis TaxID=882626 RepID=UPI0027E3ED74|nr:hypothetical protein [Pseudoalteromonas xiamenensis]WMN62089.1 hypothetical protein NI389_20030 [Pseudoalteromonas xiamenensis]